VEKFTKLEQKLDILVNNAGANWGESWETFPESAFDKVMALNVKGVFLMTRDLTPLLKAAATTESPARVINIGSIDGIRVPELETYSYSASKAAVHQLTRTMANKLAAHNVRETIWNRRVLRPVDPLTHLCCVCVMTPINAPDHSECHCRRAFPIEDDEGHPGTFRGCDCREHSPGSHRLL